MIVNKSPKIPKKSLSELLQDKTVITGKEVVQRLKEQDERRKEYQEAVEFELRNRRRR